MSPTVVLAPTTPTATRTVVAYASQCARLAQILAATQDAYLHDGVTENGTFCCVWAARDTAEEAFAMSRGWLEEALVWGLALAVREMPGGCWYAELSARERAR